MTSWFCIILAAAILTGIAKGVLATFAPKAYETQEADEERRRQRRSAFLKSAMGAGFRWWVK